MHILRKRKYFKEQPNFTPQKLKKKKPNRAEITETKKERKETQ